MIAYREIVSIGLRDISYLFGLVSERQNTHNSIQNEELGCPSLSFFQQAI